MMVAEGMLTESLQALIDARLDTIDRMLLGRVARADRLAIVREVDAQVHDLLAERGGGEVDREAVLAALARLDPPEAYLPDEETDGPSVARRPPSPRFAPRDRTDPSKGGRAGGIVGLSALGLALVAVLALAIALVASSELLYLLFLALTPVAFIVGLVGIMMSAYSRFRGSWAIVGLTTGLVSLILSPLAYGVALLLGG